MDAQGGVVCRPVVPERLADFETLFTAKGAPHYCWCFPYRRDPHTELTKEQRHDEMCALVAARTPVGLLAYEAGAPVGWCSVAPRETFPQLARSRVMPRVTPPDVPTWTVTCFFVPRTHRGQGLTRTLLAGAIDYARSSGARVIEGYPYDTAGLTSRHFGHSSIFAAQGFTQSGRRWSREV